jgi:hypothetical protein
MGLLLKASLILLEDGVSIAKIGKLDILPKGEKKQQSSSK